MQLKLKEHTACHNGTSFACRSSTIVCCSLEDARRDPQWHDDSLSSLSIESEDDTNLLSR
ncbi:hypothetical protein EVAR_73760_1, partial [Eumeta japonica]